MGNFYLSQEDASALAGFLMTMKGTEAHLLESTGAGEAVTKGKQLFGDYKCCFCHRIEGFVKKERAPDLTAFGSKHASDLDYGHVRDAEYTLRGWTVRKLLEPRAFETAQSKLSMPAYNLTEDDATALTVLLLGFNGQEMPEAYRRFEVIRNDPGRRLFEELMCVGCHNVSARRIEGSNVDNVAKDLSTVGDKVHATWMIQWLKDPRSYNSAAKMPTIRILAESQLLQLASYVMSFQGADCAVRPSTSEAEVRSVSERAVRDGRGVFESMQCYRCHRIAGRGGNIAPDLTRVGEKVQPGWLFEWLKDPENYNLAMGDDRVVALSSEEINSLGSYLLSLRGTTPYPPRIPPGALLLLDNNDDTGDAVKRGEALFGESGRPQFLFGKRVGKMGLGCYGCHRLAGKGNDIGPDLSVEGDKVNKEWLFSWLKAPGFSRQPAKMGDFHLTDEDAWALTEYLMTFRSGDGSLRARAN